MPLHRIAKGDSPLEALTQLIRRIERGGQKVTQIMEKDDDWLVQAEMARDTVEYRVTG